MEELWKQVTGYEDYDVSSLGHVRSWKYTNSPRLLKPGRAGRGYLKVSLSKDRKIKQVLVHQLVAGEFIKNMSGGKVVNHIDEDISNNIVTNLEWCSQKENLRKSYALKHDRATCGVCIDYDNHIGDKMTT
jgi:hypothetical protein